MACLDRISGEKTWSYGGPERGFPTCIFYAKAPLRTQTHRRFLEAPSSRNVTATASIWEPRKRPTCAARLFYRRRLGNLGQRICKGSRGSRGMVSFRKRTTPNFAPKDIFKLPCLTGLSFDFPINTYSDRQTSGISPSLNKLTLALAAAPRSACLFSASSLSGGVNTKRSNFAQIIATERSSRQCKP